MKKYYITLIIILFFAPVAASAYTQEECIKCHAEGSKESELHIPVKDFERSIHGQVIGCADCHKGVKNKAHQTVKGVGAVNCNQCHSQENKHGINAKAEERPACWSCHGSHDITGKSDKASKVNAGQLVNTCKTCHPGETGESSYLSWFSSVRIKSHKKQDFSQDYSRTNCTGCHQGKASHGSDEPVTKENCYVCHMKMKGNSATGYFHEASVGGTSASNTSGIIYQVAIIAVIAGIFICLFRTLKSKKRRR